LENGLVVVTEEGFEACLSIEEYETLSIQRLLNQLAEEMTKNRPQHNHLSTDRIRNFCSGLFEPKLARPRYSVVNVLAGTRAIVGFIENGEAHITKDIEFPGGTTDEPSREKAEIGFSKAWTHDANQRNYFLMSFDTAVRLAVLHFNDEQIFSEIFPNHDIALHQVRVG
jgi:hypothetical protein